MNETIDLMRRHRSVREFTPESIPDAHIHAAVEAGQRASTSSNIQAYCLIRITDPRKRHQLIQLTGGQDKVAQCGAFFVICGDSRRHRLVCDQNNLDYDARFEAFLLATVDACLFAQNFVLALESMGYGICYIGGLRTNLREAGELLEIPPGVYPLFGLCAGIPAKDSHPRNQPLPGNQPRPRLPRDAVYFEDIYPEDEAMRSLMAAYDAENQRFEQDEAGLRPPWTAQMAEKFSQPRRPAVGEYYRSQGADLS